MPTKKVAGSEVYGGLCYSSPAFYELIRQIEQLLASIFTLEFFLKHGGGPHEGRGTMWDSVFDTVMRDRRVGELWDKAVALASILPDVTDSSDVETPSMTDLSNLTNPWTPLFRYE